MLKITQTTDGSPTVLRLEGRLVGPWVIELRGVLATPPGLSAGGLDLADMVFVDDAGAELLLELRERGLALSNCSEFVSGLLESRFNRRRAPMVRRR